MQITWLALLGCIKVCSAFYGVEPEFALAVAHIESRTSTEYVRQGQIGRVGYWAPFAIHPDYKKRWAVDYAPINVLVGVKALQGKDKLRVLKRYNREYTRSYGAEVMKAYRKHKELGTFKEETG